MHLIYNKPFSYTSCYTISFPIPVLVPVSVTAPGGLQIRMLMMGSRSAEEWMSTRKVIIWLWVSTAPMKNEATFDGLSFLPFPFCFFFPFYLFIFLMEIFFIILYLKSSILLLSFPLGLEMWNRKVIHFPLLKRYMNLGFND